MQQLVGGFEVAGVDLEKAGAVIAARQAVFNPRQRLLTTKEDQHIKNPGGCSPAGQRSPERLRNLAEAETGLRRNGLHTLFQRNQFPVGLALQCFMGLRQEDQSAFV